MRKKNLSSVFSTRYNSNLLSPSQKCLSVKLRTISCPSILTFVLVAQKNRLIETVLLSTQNIYFS